MSDLKRMITFREALVRILQLTFLANESRRRSFKLEIKNGVNSLKKACASLGDFFILILSLIARLFLLLTFPVSAPLLSLLVIWRTPALERELEKQRNERLKSMFPGYRGGK